MCHLLVVLICNYVEDFLLKYEYQNVITFITQHSGINCQVWICCVCVSLLEVRSCVTKDSILVKLEHVFSYCVSTKQTNYHHISVMWLGQL
jgi:hypothetical protein